MANVFFSLRNTIRNYASASNVLIAATILAVVCANVPVVRDIYNVLWTIPVKLELGDFNLFSHGGHPLTLGAFINDALMTLFFFTVGLEIKREVLVGELSSLKKALLPIIGACGGMILPVAIYYCMAMIDENGAEYVRGCAIPMATDIAFSLAVLSMFGKRVPLALKVFLTTLAVADDIGGILVIATCFPTEMHLDMLYIAFAVLAYLAIAGGVFKVRSKALYAVLGIAVWYLFLNSGIHPTIAGVLVAFCVPSIPADAPIRYIKSIRDKVDNFPIKETDDLQTKTMLTHEQLDWFDEIQSKATTLVSPLQQFENLLSKPVNMVVLPLFAFSSAGIFLLDMTPASIFGGVTLAIVLGLVVGKCVGIFLFSWLAIITGIASKPSGSNWSMLAAVSMVGGIGFTVSLFIGTLSFPDAAHAELLNDAKLGIVLGSLLSGILGYLLLNLTLPKAKKSKNSTKE